MKKKVLSLLLASAMVASLAACGGKEDAGSNSSAPADSGTSAAASTGTTAEAQPYDLQSISIVVDGTLNMNTDNRMKWDDAQQKYVLAGVGEEGSTELEMFQQALSEAIGVEVKIDKKDHSEYKDALSRNLSISDRPDVALMSAEMYSQYSAFPGFLWDMTDAYENSDFKERITRTAVNEANRIDGRLYGFSPAAGNGCVTYLKQSWLDAVGVSDLSTIKTYQDFYDLLMKFKNDDPDQNGKGGTYGIIAAGLISSEAPWTNYLPEFWQNAYPSLYPDENGTWVDGFQSEETKAALERLKQAWADGLIDPDTTGENTSTKTAREKWFANDQAISSGALSYWAGTWRQTLTNNLKKNGVETDVVMLPKIEEMDGFLDRKAPVWVILDDGDGNNDREQAIFDAFFETMMDGDEVQTMWQYGVKGIQWDTKAETVVLDPENPDSDKNKTYAEGEFHMLPTLTDQTTLYSKNHIDNLLAVAPLTNGFGALADIVEESNSFFNDNSIPAPVLPSGEVWSNQSVTVIDAVKTAVVDFVANGKDYDTVMKEYHDKADVALDQILTELNAPAE